jgi:hypothetical protein
VTPGQAGAQAATQSTEMVATAPSAGGSSVSEVSDWRIQVIGVLGTRVVDVPMRRSSSQNWTLPGVHSKTAVCQPDPKLVVVQNVSCVPGLAGKP